MAVAYFVCVSAALAATEVAIERSLHLSREAARLEIAAHAAFALATTAAIFALVFRARKKIDSQKRALQASESKTRERNDSLSAIIQASPLAILSVGANGVVQAWNQAATELFGWTEKEVAEAPGRSDSGLREDLLSTLSPALEGHVVSGLEVALRRRDATPIELLVSMAPVHDTGGAISGAIGLFEEITVRKRSEAVRTALHEFDSRVLGGEALPTTLDFLSRRAAEIFGFPLVQISIRGHEGTIAIVSSSGKAARFAEGVTVRWDDVPEGQGPTGKAIRTRSSFFVDVERDPGFSLWRERALAFGLRKGFALPLVAGGGTLGALTLYIGEAGSFDEETRADLAGLADHLALSINAARDHERIRLQLAALESAANAVMITDRDGIIRWVNPAFESLTGYSEEEALGQTPRLLNSGAQSAAFYENLWETVLSGQVWKREIYNRRKDGSLYIEEQTITPVYGASGTITNFISIRHDVSDRRRREEEIRRLVMHDPLTSLPNRRTLEESLGRLADRARRGVRSAAILLDVDDFKLVNDALGHAGGDQVLNRLAGLFRSLLRPSDILARRGGDEFAVLLENISEEEALATAERLRRAVDDSCTEIDGKPVNLTVSIGVAPLDGTLDGQAAVTLAESALFTAKRGGRNRVVIYRSPEEAGTQGLEANLWARRIKDALRNGGFVLHFQPVVRLRAGTAEHHEVLLRMKRGDEELVYPDAFLPAAERFGLMPQVDRWVVEEVFRVLKERPHLRLFVNLSGTSLGEPALLDAIEKSVRDAQIGRGQLAFEVTESAAISDIGGAQHWIRRLKKAGCRFALDDFGIGFSSFAYLRSLPVDYVKIDKSFVTDLDSDATNRALVEAMRSVAHALGKEVIAEAVENARVAEVLRGLGVEHGQGWYFGRPGPLDAALELPEETAEAASAG